MNVLVTGALGRNGPAVVRRLLQDGHNVVSFDAQAGFGTLRDLVGTVQFVTGNVTDVSALAGALRDHAIHGIIHLAATADGRTANEHPNLAINVNCGGTAAVLEAARQAGVKRIAHASSVSCYVPFTGRFGHPTYDPVDERYPTDLPYEPGQASDESRRTAIYGATKRLAEKIGLHYAEEFGIQFVALRFSMILSPELPPLISSPELSPQRRRNFQPQAAMIEAALVGKSYSLKSGGDERADFVYVKDLAQSLVRALDAPGDVTGIYNIGSGRLSSLPEIASAVQDEIPDADITIGPGLDFLNIGRTYCLFDIGRARNILGYEPQFSDIRHAVSDYIADAQTRRKTSHN